MARKGKTSEADDGNLVRRTQQGKSDISGGSAAVSLDEPLLDANEAAVLLKVRVSWMRDASREGKLPCLRIGRHLRFMRVMLEEWLVAQFDGPAPHRGRVAAMVPDAAVRPGRVPFRPRTEAALLASLAEVPKPSKHG